MDTKEILQADAVKIDKQIEIAQRLLEMAEYNKVGIELQRQKRASKVILLQAIKSEISTKLGLLEKEGIARK